MQTLYKERDKILLYTLEECQKKNFYYPINNSGEFQVYEFDGFELNMIDGVVLSMIEYLGKVVTIKKIVNSQEFWIEGDDEAWWFPFKLIKEKIL